VVVLLAGLPLQKSLLKVLTIFCMPLIVVMVEPAWGMVPT
jgi:hypothetical protein